MIPNDLRSLLFRSCEQSAFKSKNCIDFFSMNDSFKTFEYNENYYLKKFHLFEQKISAFTKYDKKTQEKEINKLKAEVELEMSSLE
jgi:hypothetical protein